LWSFSLGCWFEVLLSQVVGLPEESSAGALANGRGMRALALPFMPPLSGCCRLKGFMANVEQGKIKVQCYQQSSCVVERSVASSKPAAMKFRYAATPHTSPHGHRVRSCKSPLRSLVMDSRIVLDGF
jgi:hypothetical protein